MSRRRAVTNHLTNNDPIKRSERAHVTAAPTALQNTSESRNVQPRSFNEDALGSHATHLVFDPEQASISWSLIINVTCHKKENTTEKSCSDENPATKASCQPCAETPSLQPAAAASVQRALAMHNKTHPFVRPKPRGKDMCSTQRSLATSINNQVINSHMHSDHKFI